MEKLEAEEGAEAFGLDAGDGDFGALFVVHAELKAGLEPGDESQVNFTVGQHDALPDQEPWALCQKHPVLHRRARLRPTDEP